MARDLETIQESILTQKEQASSLNGLEVLTTRETQSLDNLTSDSKVSIWRLWVYIMSLAIYSFETIMDAFEVHIKSLIADNQIHTSRWYQERILEFQLGFDLDRNIGAYNNEGVEASVVEESKIIDSASVESLEGFLRIKVAKVENGELTRLNDTELQALSAYINIVKDAGTKLILVSQEPDLLRINIDICFDPLVIDSTGARIDGTNDNPVKEAIETYLYNLEFNGEFVTKTLETQLEAVEGVLIAETESVSSQFASNDFVEIDKTYVSNAGYMILDEDNININFEPRVI